MGQGSLSGTVSHAIYQPLAYKLLLVVHEVHLKQFYEKRHDFIFGVKITLWIVWLSNTFQTNNVVVPFKFIILIFLKNSFLGGFSWKGYFICGRWFCRCWVNCLVKCLMHITAEDVGCQSFLLTNFIHRFFIFSSLGNENTETVSSPL